MKSEKAESTFKKYKNELNTEILNGTRFSLHSQNTVIKLEVNFISKMPFWEHTQVRNLSSWMIKREN